MPYRSLLFILSFIILLPVSPLSTVNITSQARAGTAQTAGQYREDINGDGKVHITDVISLLLLGRDNPGDPRADYNGDGEYAISDAITLLLNIITGKLTPVEPEDKTQLIQGVTMLYIPPGSFLMGSTQGYGNEQPVDSVTLRAFWMSETEITQEQYHAVTGENPSFFTGSASLPVERVSWHAAAKFCNRLSALAGLDSCYRVDTWECDPTKNGFRLPNEAEWEYACLAGTGTKYYTGDTESKLARAGWYFKNSNGSTHIVGRKEENAFGLYDMHGNVWEWCNDLYTISEGPVSSKAEIFQITRGGAWDYRPFFCRAAFRNYERPESRYACVGFRVVRGYF